MCDGGFVTQYPVVNMAFIILTKKIDTLVNVDSMRDEDLSRKVFDVEHIFGAKLRSYAPFFAKLCSTESFRCPARGLSTYYLLIPSFKKHTLFPTFFFC